MDINIVSVEPIVDSRPRYWEGTEVKQISLQTAETTAITLKDIFAKFLQMEVGDGAASADTIRLYLS